MNRWLQTLQNRDWQAAVRAEAKLVKDGLFRSVPRALTYIANRVETLLDVVEYNAEQRPHALAFEMDDVRMTWGDLVQRTSDMAYVLHAKGVRQGDVVALMGTNHPEYVALVLAITRVGATAALINHHLHGQSLNHVLTASRLSLVVVESTLQAHIGSSERGACLPWPVLVYGTQGYHAALQDTPQARFPKAPVKSRDDFVYIYTSGTTGLPKPCRIAHARALASGLGFGVAMFEFSPGDKLYCVLPLYHASALLLGVSACIMMQTPMALRAAFSARAFWTDIERYGATAILYIGELCRYLLQAQDAPANTHSVRVAVGNGLRSDIWEDFQRRFGIQHMREFYAATEGPGFLMNFSGKKGSVGRLPLGGMGWIKLVRHNVELGAPYRDEQGFCVLAADNEPGEMLVKLSALLANPATDYRGYTDQKATEKKVLRHVFRHGDQYFRTGDLLRRDREGFYYFVDRIGDTYRYKGENVSTAEVADVLMQLDALAEVTVVGVSVPGQDGQAGLAALVLKDNNSTHSFDPTSFDLASFTKVAQTLPKYAQPVFLRVVSSMNTTSTFKIQKTQLQKDGVDPNFIQDPLYVRTSQGYVPLTKKQWQMICQKETRL